jgi:hypothetical protein
MSAKIVKSVGTGRGKATIREDGTFSLLDDDSPYGKSVRVKLNPAEALNLASALLQYATQNREANE